MITVEGDSDSSIQVVGLTKINAFGRIHQNIDEKHGRLLKKSLVRYSLTRLYAPRVSRLVGRTCNIAVNPDRHRDQKPKSLYFSVSQRVGGLLQSLLFHRVFSHSIAVFAAQGTEVFGLNIETGKVTNYSNAPNQYDEPEGIFPDGKYTTVECDRHNPKGPQYDDIYKLALDGSGKIERLTFFADYPGYKASNPVISDDGKYMAFQYAKAGDWAGIGRGILIFDLLEYEKTKKLKPPEDK